MTEQTARRGCYLPIGTLVRVTPLPIREQQPFVAKVVGYDMGRTKYELGARYMGWSEWLFLDGGTWAFPGEVEAISEGERDG